MPHIACPHIAFPNCFFANEGGVSKGVYKSLNCGPGSNDIVDHISENRRRTAQHLSGSAETPLLSLYQIHSNEVVTVSHNWETERPKADGMVTATKGLILGILTADCTPVLFADNDAGVIGAAHAGWKGALTGILENTITAMEKLGARRLHIRAAIGPTIHPDSYEVTTEFRDNFLDHSSAYNMFFTQGKDEFHYQFNLPSFVEMRLQASGLSHIWNAGIDTYKSPCHFSYRRTTHRSEADYGRQLSAIMLP